MITIETVKATKSGKIVRKKSEITHPMKKFQFQSSLIDASNKKAKEIRDEKINAIRDKIKKLDKPMKSRKIFKKGQRATLVLQLGK